MHTLSVRFDAAEPEYLYRFRTTWTEPPPDPPTGLELLEGRLRCPQLRTLVLDFPCPGFLSVDDVITEFIRKFLRRDAHSLTFCLVLAGIVADVSIDVDDFILKATKKSAIERIIKVPFLPLADGTTIMWDFIAIAVA